MPSMSRSRSRSRSASPLLAAPKSTAAHILAQSIKSHRKQVNRSLAKATAAHTKAYYAARDAERGGEGLSRKRLGAFREVNEPAYKSKRFSGGMCGCKSCGRWRY